MSDVQKIELPDYLKNMMDDSAKDMVTSGTSAPRISLRGQKFRFKVDGNEEEVTSDPINIIILGVIPESHMAKTFYISGYVPGSTDPPDCSSFFGEVPDTWVSSPQSTFCRDCGHQVWGSAKSMSGGKSKACKDSKRLVVIKAADAKQEDPVKYLINITIASLKALSAYGKFLIDNKLPMAACITQVYFIDSDFPQVEFKFLGVLNEAVGKPLLMLSSKKEWMEDKPDIKQIAHQSGSGAPVPDKQVQQVEQVQQVQQVQQVEQVQQKIIDQTPEDVQQEIINQTSEDVNDLLNKW
jgi:hypothetical protein